MPTDLASDGGDSAVIRLFRLRNERRRGKLQDAGLLDTLQRWGDQNLGMMGGGEPRAPSGPAAPPAGGSTVVGGAKPVSRTGIPTLDALADMPRKRTRGLMHDRKLGRITGGM